MKASKKKKLEFTQKWLIGCAVLTFLFLGLSFLWAALGFDPLQDLSIAIVQATLSQNSVRAYSADRWGFKSTHDEDEEEDAVG